MNTALLLLTTFLLFVVQYIIFRLKRKQLEQLIEKFPGPPAYPISGNTHLAIGTPKDVLNRGFKICKTFGSPFRLWLLHKPIILIFDPENFQIVANKTLQKAHGYKFFEELMGQGLITANGEYWRRNRRMLNPTFNPSILNQYFLSVFNKQNSKLLQSLEAEANTGREFDLFPHCLKCFLNTICMTSMNYKDEEETGLFKYGDAILKTSLLVSQRFYKPWLHLNFLYKIYEHVTGYTALFDFVQTLPRKIIEKKKEEKSRQKENTDQDNGTELEEKSSKSFLDMVLNSENTEYFSDKQLADEIITLITAGSETSSINVCFTLLMLAMHPDVQEKVYEELYTVFGDSDRPINTNDIKELVFLEQCVKETLRRFSPVPFVFRDAFEDIELKDGKVIPQGTTIFLAIFGMHNNAEIYEKPYLWNPDRMSLEEMKKRHPASFAAFSIGPRSCIAAKYALLSIRTQVATVLRKYKLSTDMKMSDIKLTFDLMLRSANGYKIRIERREVEKRCV